MIQAFFICLRPDFHNHTWYPWNSLSLKDTTSVANSITFLIILSLERFFSRAGATLHNVPREWAFLKGVTSVNWKMTGWEDKRQKGRSMTPCDVAVSRLNTRPQGKRRIHLHQIWQGVCFLKTAWGRKKAHKGSIWPECVFSTSVDAECFYNRPVACQNPPRHFFQP